MAACTLHRELQIGISFFHQVNQRNIHSGGAESGPVFYFSATLIQQEFKLHTTAFQCFGYRESTLIQGLLVIAESEIGSAAELPAMGEKIFCGFQNPENHVLNVQRAAAPDISVRHCTGKGIIRPVLLSAQDNRNNILMGHIEAGQKSGIGTRQGDQHGMTDQLKNAIFHNGRKTLLYESVQAFKLAEIRQTVVSIVYGSAAYGIGKMTDCPVDIKIRIEVFSGKKVSDGVHGSLSSR